MQTSNITTTHPSMGFPSPAKKPDTALLFLMLLSIAVIGIVTFKTYPQLPEKEKEVTEKMQTNFDVKAKKFQDFLKALAHEESGCHWGENTPVKGDGGRSLGPFQICKDYHTDSGVEGPWSSCSGWFYSVQVMNAYWARYCPEALRDHNFEVLVRTNAGGPTGRSEESSVYHWLKVKARMEKE